MSGMKATFRFISILAGALLATGLLSSCHDQIFEDLSECPQGVVFTFDILHPDGIEYSTAVKEIRLFAFDKEGKLIGEYTDKPIESFGPNHSLTTDLYKPGQELTFIAWGGANLGAYDFSGFAPGTSMAEMTVALAKQADKIKAEAAPLFVSQKKVTLTQEERVGTRYDRVHIDFIQLTNRIDLVVEGFAEGVKPAVRFVAQNSHYAADGSLRPDTPFEYLPKLAETADGKQGGALHAVFDILKLDPTLDYPVEIYDEATGEVLYSFDLLKDYILYNGPFAQGDRGYTLDRNHHFDIWILLDRGPRDTYMAVQARILKWNLVFRNESLS